MASPAYGLRHVKIGWLVFSTLNTDDQGEPQAGGSTRRQRTDHPDRGDPTSGNHHSQPAGAPERAERRADRRPRCRRAPNGRRPRGQGGRPDRCRAEGGTGGFCSGGDVKDGASGPGGEKGVPVDALSGDLSRHDLHAAMLLHVMPKPTIAMVAGPAVGAGCSLAAACDLRFASEDAVFSVSFSPNGLSGDYGGSIFWTRIGGTALARRLYLLNEKIAAPRALELGMVHAVLPPAELSAYTYEVAETLVRTPSTLLALVKDNLNAAEDEDERRRWLFAHEAENQLTSAKTSRRRAKERGTPRSRRRSESVRPAGARVRRRRCRCRCRCRGVEGRGCRGQWPAPHGHRGRKGAEDPGGDDPSLVQLHPCTLAPKCWREARRT